MRALWPCACVQGGLKATEAGNKRLSAQASSAAAGVVQQESEKRALQQTIDDQARQVRF